MKRVHINHINPSGPFYHTRSVEDWSWWHGEATWRRSSLRFVRAGRSLFRVNYKRLFRA